MGNQGQHHDIEVILDDAITAYEAAITQDEELTQSMFELMSEYVAMRLHVTEKTAQLLFSARLSIVRIQRALDKNDG